ncbi:L-histidine N(alpha)-methyltransferase [Stakelama tenebrarum]|uniref:L-histidine N(Alpha)-methyltransferase n=1 Tax=Stakelama tenebrarum TaxID=2711215 RepID=A0A6G6Y9R5_9SPHN|nr:L-histidine N(alpha)-methyltransferase [Sphingosinithalassobacter tenebrarum]QIG81659.1 L-histidine N(alpha)-methyltransferase [Sphingosinithalassobacter tenebrarum]
MLKPEIEDGETVLPDPAFRADVLAGLATEPKAIQARWLYDHRGSELFEDITDVPEYYPTRTETALLRETCPKVAEIAGKGRAVVEFGSGSSAKTPILLEAAEPAAYVPIDISGDFLRASADALRDTFPALPIHPVEGNFLQPIALPDSVADTPKLGFFPGSTIGNMTASAGVDLLRAMRTSLGEGSLLLIGMDRVKDESVLIPAYDDSAGVTAAFNLNLLHRINRELDGHIPVDSFRHKAVWNDGLARVEMHLEAIEDVAFTVADTPFTMAAGETIHTENSHKYTPRSARLLLNAGGWTPIAEWTDPKDWFALILAEAKPVRRAP